MAGARDSPPTLSGKGSAERWKEGLWEEGSRESCCLSEKDGRMGGRRVLPTPPL